MVGWCQIDCSWLGWSKFRLIPNKKTWIRLFQSTISIIIIYHFLLLWINFQRFVDSFNNGGFIDCFQLLQAVWKEPISKILVLVTTLLVNVFGVLPSQSVVENSSWVPGKVLFFISASAGLFGLGFLVGHYWPSISDYFWPTSIEEGIPRPLGDTTLEEILGQAESGLVSEGPVQLLAD